jgi:hypothetical protein
LRATSPLAQLSTERSLATHRGRVRKSTNFYTAGLNNMKKSANRGESPSRLIDARVKELDAWRGKTLSHVRALVTSLMGTLMPLDI